MSLCRPAAMCSRSFSIGSLPNSSTCVLLDVGYKRGRRELECRGGMTARRDKRHDGSTSTTHTTAQEEDNAAQHGSGGMSNHTSTGEAHSRHNTTANTQLHTHTHTH